MKQCSELQERCSRDIERERQSEKERGREWIEREREKKKERKEV